MTQNRSTISVIFKKFSRYPKLCIMTSARSGEMFEGDFPDTCGKWISACVNGGPSGRFKGAQTGP